MWFACKITIPGKSPRRYIAGIVNGVSWEEGEGEMVVCRIFWENGNNSETFVHRSRVTLL